MNLLTDSDANPRQIWSDVSSGLDFRLAKRKGMFGKAVYFAERTAYSDAKYAHRVDDSDITDEAGIQQPNLDGLAQLFLARVAVGRCDRYNEATEATQGLTRPQGTCHSVRGPVTPDRHNWAIMTYEDNQSYPAYLITYRQNDNVFEN
jgi:hypothetical protein